MTTIDIAPHILDWAIERSGKTIEDLARSMPALTKWIAGTATPTYPQLEKFAKSTYVPFGALFLSTPPEDFLTITDFRIMAGMESIEPSPNLIDTIDICILRRDWYREYRIRIGADQIPQINSLSRSNSPFDAARLILKDLRIDSYASLLPSDLDEAFKLLSEKIESAGIMVMVNGVVGLNTRRKLDLEEFRGFALSDEYAPLIFVNGTDSKAGKIFTLIHELAHLYLGDSGVSLIEPKDLLRETNSHEHWCNTVAEEFLLPAESMIGQFQGFGKSNTDFFVELDQMADALKASGLAILIRLKNLALIEPIFFERHYGLVLERARRRFEERNTVSSGGNFYNTQGIRTGKLFSRALIADTLSGNTLHRDAYRLLGIKTHTTFQNFAEKMGVS